MLAVALIGAAMSVEPYEPKDPKQAKGDVHWKYWHEAIKDEHKSLIQNKTWKLVERPKDRKVLRGRWVYKLKRGPKGEVLRYKARWVVRGFEQEEGIDYNETFASVVKPMSYKALFAIAVALDLEVEQMDLKTVFLYGDIDEEIYVEQPTGMDDGTDGCASLGRPCTTSSSHQGFGTTHWRRSWRNWGLKQSRRISASSSRATPMWPSMRTTS